MRRKLLFPLVAGALALALLVGFFQGLMWLDQRNCRNACAQQGLQADYQAMQPKRGKRGASVASQCRCIKGSPPEPE